MQVIALLEAYARKSPQAGLLARALPVLLSSLQHALRAGPPQQALAERLRGLVSNKLCKWGLLHLSLCSLSAEYTSGGDHGMLQFSRLQPSPIHVISCRIPCTMIIIICHHSWGGGCKRTSCDCRAKASGTVEAEDAAQVLRKLLSLTSRGDDKALTQTASTAFLYVLRHSPPAEAIQVCLVSSSVFKTCMLVQ